MKTLEELLEGLPADIVVSAEEVQQARANANDTTVYVVLDDDPTGTQSVADLPVLTSWEKEDFDWAYSTGKAAIYVMTNSRSLAPADAEAVNREVVAAALASAKESGTHVAFVSRSDSTMRGHFPLEPNTIGEEVEKATGEKVDGIVVVPAFGDAGRITIKGTHYAGSVATGFVPVGETEFAKDATFGYKSSYLPDWVEEKTGGGIKADDVIVLDLTTLRTDRAKAVEMLRSAKDSAVITVDIVTEEDLRLLALALIDAESAGSSFVYRVGPPFVRARIGQAVHPPLTVEEINASRGDRELAKGGLIVVGSHVGLTTRQLNTLRERQTPVEYEIDVAKVIDSDQRDAHIADIAEQAAAKLNDGNVVIRTSRKLVTGADADASLDISRQVSAAVVGVVQGILAANPPKFVVAKGGITSSDTASKGLAIRHALVIGPMLPGIVSLWSGQDGPAAGIPYIVFAGNVGDDESLAVVVDKLSQ
ncbi:MAG: hypothetical protein GX483_07505 [Actinomycetaceae bacterium]|nr:hypothetical protein [Actinomycetaceae bacterium]